jgi:hypothetical protein
MILRPAHRNLPQPKRICLCISMVLVLMCNGGTVLASEKKEKTEIEKKAEPAAEIELSEEIENEAEEQDNEDKIKLQRPQGKPLSYALPPIDPSKVDAPSAAVRRESIPVPDRWRIMESLGMKENWLDPYNQNTLKGDKPFKPLEKFGEDWFFNLALISDSLLELRRLPTPFGLQSSNGSGALDVFGQGDQFTLNQNFIVSAAIIQGNTTFKPPDYEFRAVIALNANYSEAKEVRALFIDPQRGRSRNDQHIGLQELFFDKHLRNVSDNYDFDSLRIGLQPFISDFRGFVFQDNAFGVRLFGTRDNNRWQYNLGLFRRMEKDTNSGLNDVTESLRADDTLMVNLFRQDFPVLGHTTQISLMHNVNREGNRKPFINTNGFPERPSIFGDERPHNYYVTYLGVNGDGHFGRWNLTSSLYLASGNDERNPLSQLKSSIRAGFFAAELSRDFDWLRARATAMVASGDSDPFDDKATGFDAIFENPQIAGADTSFWIRQGVPLVGGGGVALSSRNAWLPSLRSSKEHGQSNFVNPGLVFLGVGADADVLPQLRVSANLAALNFQNTSSLEVLRNQADIDRNIGIDVSASAQYRPLMSQNIVLLGSLSALLPGKGFRQLYDEDQRGPQYSILFNVLLSY